MSWFEAWLIWRLDAFAHIFLAITVLGGALLFTGIIVWSVGRFGDDCDVKKENRPSVIKLGRRFVIWGCIIFIVNLFITGIVPNTKTFFKIAATKYGVDAFTSQEAANIGNNMLDSIDKAQQLLNQKLDKLIESPAENAENKEETE